VASIYNMRPGVDFFIPLRRDETLKIVGIEWKYKTRWDEYFWVQHCLCGGIGYFRGRQSGHRVGWRILAENGDWYDFMVIASYLRAGLDVSGKFCLNVPKLLENWI